MRTCRTATASVTAEPGLGLAVLVADCVPILAGDPAAGRDRRRARRAAGRGGRHRRCGCSSRWPPLGAAAGGITVVLGPAICGRCYEVPASMRDEVDAGVARARRAPPIGAHPGFDLRAGLARQLRAAGVAEVVIDPRCTYTDPGLFSHRRSAPTGRFAGLIWLPS